MKDTTVRQEKVKPLSSGEVSLFCSQIVLLLKAGIPLKEGVGEISDNVEDENVRELIRRIQASIEQNGSLYLALNSTGAFPKYMVNMVNIGEKAGNLENVMEALSLYYDRENNLRSCIRSALLYPFILVLMIAAVIAVLVIKVLPIFHQVFLDMGSDISDTASSVMRAGSTIGTWALAIILILAVLLLAALLLYKTESGYRFISGFLHNFPLTRKLSGKIALARFASVLSMLLSSGYNTEEALALAPGVLNNRIVLDKVEQCRSFVASGTSFTQALTKAGIFPGIYSSMVNIGDKTGNLDGVMKRLAELYGDDANEALNRAVSIIEPVMVGVLSVIIGAILLSVMLPLMGIMSSIG